MTSEIIRSSQNLLAVIRARTNAIGVAVSFGKDSLACLDLCCRMYPHFDLSRCYRNAVLQPHWTNLDKAVAIKMTDIETAFRHDAKIDWIAYGWRRNDSFSRALIMKKCAGLDFDARRVFPIRSWTRTEVYAYLDERGIPRPPTLGRKEQGGLDFNPSALAELKEKHPADYQRWLTDFPFSVIQEEPRSK